MINFAAMIIIKRILAVFLLVGILTNCFNYLLVESSYQFNKAYISTVLCSNKDKPHLHCEGKCFLDIKLKELEQKNKQAQENLKRSIETITSTSVLVPKPIFKVLESVQNSSYLPQKPVERNITIFQPPRLA